MLVLTRKTGQKLIINDNIEIIILETRGESVKIGIKAPKNITVYREEIYEEIKKANQQSGSTALLTDLNSVFNLFESNKPGQSGYISKNQAVIKISKSDNADKE